jgi:lipid A 3-O-deacylase
VRRALALLAAGASLDAAAAEQPGWYLQVDNDVVYRTDRWYTSGVRIADVLDRGDHGIEWGVLQEIYTPEAKRTNPIDRPNAARLLATFARHDRSDDAWRTLELDAGVTGPAALGRQAQDFVHRFVPAPHEEWGHQRSNRFDGELAWVRTQDLGIPTGDWPRVKAHYGAVLGNQIAFAHAGIELRIGEGAAAALSTPAIRFAATPPITSAADGSWSAFLGASVRAVAWNHLLDFAPNLDTATPERRRFVHRFVGGVTWAGRYAAVTFTLVDDGREFVGQRLDHGFGSLTLHVPF